MIKHIAILLASMSLFKCGEVDRRPQRLVYQAFFPNKVCCEVDLLQPPERDLDRGRSNAGELAYLWNARSGLLLLQAPNPIASGTTPSVGAFSTGVSYGANTSFTLKAAFQNPVGPHLPEVPGATNAWSVGLSARTGGIDDDSTLPRLTVTLRIKNRTAHLNIQGWKKDSGNKPVAEEIHADMYDWIFVQKKTFVLELYVDRVGRTGIAEIHAGGLTMKRSFDFKDDFLIPDSAPITAVGATLSNCCSHGQFTSVHLKDFEIYAE